MHACACACASSIVIGSVDCGRTAPLVEGARSKHSRAPCSKAYLYQLATRPVSHLAHFLAGAWLLKELLEVRIGYRCKKGPNRAKRQQDYRRVQTPGTLIQLDCTQRRTHRAGCQVSLEDRTCARE